MCTIPETCTACPILGLVGSIVFYVLFRFWLRQVLTHQVPIIPQCFNTLPQLNVA